MSDPVPASAERAKIFTDLSLILTRADARNVRFYSTLAGGPDRMNDGALIRALPEQYQLSNPAILNLGRLYASIGRS